MIVVDFLVAIILSTCIYQLSFLGTILISSEEGETEGKINQCIDILVLVGCVVLKIYKIFTLNKCTHIYLWWSVSYPFISTDIVWNCQVVSTAISILRHVDNLVLHTVHGGFSVRLKSPRVSANYRVIFAFHAENAPKMLGEFNINTGTRLKCDDFLQVYDLVINVMHV